LPFECLPYDGIADFSVSRIVRLELGQQDPSLSTLAKPAKVPWVTVVEVVEDVKGGTQWSD